MKIRGLLLKDIFELSAQCRVQLVLTGVYLLLPLFIRGIELFASVGMMLLAMMPVYALGYDERCRWERYALAMPVRKSDLFWSRFLLGVIAVALGAAVQVLRDGTVWSQVVYEDQTGWVGSKFLEIVRN